MGLFGNGHEACRAKLLELEQRLDKLESLLQRVRADASDLAERAYRNLKKAEARARREDLVESGPDQPPSETPTSPTARGLWGARGRRATRLLRRPPTPDAESGEANGVHP